MVYSPQNITLISCGNFDPKFINLVADAIRKAFYREVSIRNATIELIEYYDPARRQYNGDLLLKKVDALRLPEDHKVIGLFQVDLFIPILTYIFGQAYLNGTTGISSTYRLYNERYGLKPDHELLLNRFKKEVIHELGHEFGLIHCHTPGCVMQSSTYVEDIDQKTIRFCDPCNIKLGI
ncbi:archaemetzincin family Zn-dependent metalloprotease [Saccharicrinis sp. FJH54]|uniref:archaemetzincin family Zn-dependent metalloprotease n=1 Tax=Saccharicrinis sp. FJH54 TaxID=3344665 RepID=UPI0035D47F49